MGMGSAPKSAVVHSHSARSTMTHVQQEGGEDDKAKHSNFLAAEPRSGHYDSSHGGSGSYGDGYGDSYGDSGGYGARDKDEFFSGAASSYSKSGGGGSGGASFGSRTDKAGSGGGYSSSSSRGRFLPNSAMPRPPPSWTVACRPPRISGPESGSNPVHQPINIPQATSVGLHH